MVLLIGKINYNKIRTKYDYFHGEMKKYISGLTDV